MFDEEILYAIEPRMNRSYMLYTINTVKNLINSQR